MDQCPDCFGRMSPLASRCPRCGWKRSDAGWRGVSKVLIGMLAGVGAGLVGLIIFFWMYRTGRFEVADWLITPMSPLAVGEAPGDALARDEPDGQRIGSVLDSEDPLTLIAEVSAN